MPAIPETWRDQFTVNLTTNNSQSDPEITQLANGNILVCWTTSDTGGLGAPAGDEVFGQLFDPLGNRIGVEFRLNGASTTDQERNGQVAALPGGGFIVVYHDLDIGGGPGSNIRLDEYDANGVAVSDDPGVVIDATVNGDPNFRNPRVAVSSVTSVLVVYEQITAGVSRIVGKVYDPTTDTYSAQFFLLSGGGGSGTTAPDVIALTNGNYVVVANRGGTDPAIVYRVVDSAGTGGVASFVGDTFANTFSDIDASVAALAGGGFVIAWTNTDTDTDIVGRIYDSAGTETGSFSAESGLSNNNNNESVVTGLADGSFVVVYDNDSSSRLDVTHFSATGTALGTFTIAAGGSTPAVTDLGDGRFAVVWSDSAGEISIEILDTRDAPNATGVYTPDQWVVGTVGDDVFTSAGGAEFTHGWDGNDTITEFGGTRSYFGDDGDDTLIVVSAINTDLHDGGNGTDTIDWSASGATNPTFDLQAGTATQAGVTEVMVGFEFLIGTADNDTILGNADGNSLSGGAGDDTLDGRVAIDLLVGGAGNDLYFVDTIGDIIIETAGDGTDDRVSASVSFVLAAGLDVELLQTTLGAGLTAINLTGNALAQQIFGNAGDNLLNDGGAGAADTLTGGAGNDTYQVNNAGDGIVESAGGGIDRVLASLSFVLAADVAVERMETTAVGGTDAINLTGNGLAQSIFGNAGANRLAGGGGQDTLSGGTGSDRLAGGSGADRLLGGAGSDTLAGGGGADVLQLGGGADRAGGGGGADLIKGGGGSDILAGGGGSDRLNGGAGGDVLNGGGRDDRLFGNGGADRLVGARGNDVMTGGNGADVFVFGRGAGQDDVTDFRNGQDRVDLTGPLTFADLTETAIAGGVRLTITAAPAHHIDLLGVTVAQIEAGDFI